MTGKTIVLSVLILTLSGFVYAQKSSSAEFEKVKQIRLLYDDREDVRRVLADYKSDFSESDDEEFTDEFPAGNARIDVYYSRGDCSPKDVWMADKWTVTKIEIEFEKPVKLKNFKFDFSGYRKENEDEDEPNSYVLYNDGDGLAFEIEDKEIETIKFFPSKDNHSQLCKNDSIKSLASSDEGYMNLMLHGIIVCPAANVDDLILETSEIFADCEDAEKRINCAVSYGEISVQTKASDPDNDPLTYQYTVSGGKIGGQGASVAWDVSGLKPGSYTITAAVDDGCGFCGQTQTRTLVVK